MPRRFNLSGETLILKTVGLPSEALVPLSIEWPEEFYERNEESIYVEIQGKRVPFFEASLELTFRDTHGANQISCDGRSGKCRI